MRRIGVVCLVLWLSLAVALPSLAQNEIPALDATYCADGLQFNYPSSLYGAVPETESEATDASIVPEINVASQVVLRSLLGKDSKPFSIYISFYKDPEFLALFDPMIEDHSYPLLAEILRRYSDLLVTSTLEELAIHSSGEKLFFMRVWSIMGEDNFILFDNGFMVRAAYIQNFGIEGDEWAYYEWRDMALAIIDTLTYDPVTPCASPTPTNSPPAGTPARRK